MVQISDSLTWELVKNNNSFMKKVNGSTKRGGTMRFSVEQGNLMSLSTFKYSGIANSKAVDVVVADNNTAKLVKKTATKAHSHPKKSFSKTSINKHFRRVEKTILSQAIDNYYRPDLKSETLAKFSAVYSANRKAKGVKKVVPMKKGRASS
eukprot:scaffold17896_cov58-Attheya_sp.AAC.1